MEPLIDAVFVTSLNSGNDCIQVYDGATGTQLKSYRGYPASPSTLTLVGTTSHVMCAKRDKPFLQAWNINRHETLQMRLILPGRISTLTVSPKAPHYCVAAIGEKLYLYKLLTGRLVGIASRHYQPITRLEFTSCGNYFASAGEDGFVFLWSLATFNNTLHKTHPPDIQPHFTLGQHSDKVTGLTITSGGMRGLLVSCSLDHTARVFDLVTGRQVYSLITATPLTAIATNTLGSQVFLGNKAGHVIVVNLLPPPPPGDVQVSEEGTNCHEKAVLHMAVTALGNRLLTGSEDGEVKMWTVTDVSLGTDAPCRPRLAIYRTIHTKRGTITNLIITRMEREVLNNVDLDVREIITPFSQDHSRPLNAPVTIRAKRRISRLQQDLGGLHVTPLTSVGAEVNQNKCSRNDNDLSSQLSQLQVANSQLYMFALKHILNEDIEL